MNVAFVIPVYRHGSTLESVITSLLPYSRPFIVVDDGNTASDLEYINEVEKKYSDVHVVHLKKNCGKGKAMTQGVKKAFELGFSHVFQIDADGQHLASDCKAFIEAAEKNPECLINGVPVYDESAPSLRKSAREFSNNWARIVSWSSNIKDVLCGFRIYPVKPYIALLRRFAWINRRMGYDVDILVHLLWSKVHLVNLPVHVTYPADGISNFRMVRDNIGISLTFTRLCIGMILRFPILLFRKITGTLP